MKELYEKFIVIVFSFCSLFRGVVYADAIAPYPYKIVEDEKVSGVVICILCVVVAVVLAITTFVILKLFNKKLNKENILENKKDK